MDGDDSSGSTWFYGIIGTTFGWVVSFFGINLLPASLVGFLVLVSWVGLPLSVLLDGRALRKSGDWPKWIWAYVVLATLPLVGALVGVTYVWQRANHVEKSDPCDVHRPAEVDRKTKQESDSTDHEDKSATGDAGAGDDREWLLEQETTQAFGKPPNKNIENRPMTSDYTPSTDSEEFAELTAFQRDILIILAGSDHNIGLEIKDELEEYYDETVNHGRLYPNLDKLVEKGLLSKVPVDDRSNEYDLTDHGRALLRDRIHWADSMVPTEPPGSAGSSDEPASNLISVDAEIGLSERELDQVAEEFQSIPLEAMEALESIRGFIEMIDTTFDEGTVPEADEVVETFDALERDLKAFTADMETFLAYLRRETEPESLEDIKRIEASADQLMKTTSEFSNRCAEFHTALTSLGVQTDVSAINDVSNASAMIARAIDESLFENQLFRILRGYYFPESVESELPKIVGLITEGSPDQRLNSSFLLLQLAKENPDEVARHTDDLIAYLPKAPESEQQNILAALIHLADAGSLSNQHDIEPILGLVRTGDPTRSSYAALFASELSTTEEQARSIVSGLRPHLSDTSDPELLLNITSAFCRVGESHPDVVRPFIEDAAALMNHSRPRVSKNILELLTILGDRAFEERIERFRAESNDKELRNAATEALEKLSEDAGPTGTATGGDAPPSRGDSGGGSPTDPGTGDKTTATGTPSSSPERLVVRDLPEGRLDALTVKIVEVTERGGNVRDQELLVETTGGEQLGLTIWSKHDIDVDWKTDEWYTLREPRHRIWDSDDGSAHSLNSTTDFQAISTDSPGVDTDVRTGPEQTKQDDPPTHDGQGQNTVVDRLIEDIDFEDAD